MLNEVPNGFGQPSAKIYSDVADLAEITSLPVEGHIHRDVDAAILKAQEELKVPTAILSPPLVHGVGGGPMKTRSIQIPFLTEAILKRGKAFQVLDGQNIWDGEFIVTAVRLFNKWKLMPELGTHIDDIAAAFIVLVEESLKPNGGKAQWGSQGYYFADGAEFVGVSRLHKKDYVANMWTEMGRCF